jgi:hypothetical protein
VSAFRNDLFASSSLVTSAVYFVGDAEELTAFLDIDSATTCVLQGSNAQGFREAIAEDEWSTLTTMVSVSANQLVNIEPGFRWLRGLRETASNASWASLVVAGRNTTRRS